MDITRRFMLLATVAAGELLVRPGVALAGASVAARLRTLVPHPASARRLGLVYLAQRPEEAGEETLARHILASLRLHEHEIATQSAAALRAMLAVRVRADFAEAHTTMVDGWILSRTEARLCALCV